MPQGCFLTKGTGESTDSILLQTLAQDFLFKIIKKGLHQMLNLGGKLPKALKH